LSCACFHTLDSLAGRDQFPISGRRWPGFTFFFPLHDPPFSLLFSPLVLTFLIRSAACLSGGLRSIWAGDCYWVPFFLAFRYVFLSPKGPYRFTTPAKASFEFLGAYSPLSSRSTHTFLPFVAERGQDLVELQVSSFRLPGAVFVFFAHIGDPGVGYVESFSSHPTHNPLSIDMFHTPSLFFLGFSPLIRHPFTVYSFWPYGAISKATDPGVNNVVCPFMLFASLYLLFSYGFIAFFARWPLSTEAVFSQVSTVVKVFARGPFFVF